MTLDERKEYNQQARAQLRRYMDGVVAAEIRELGLPYSMVFGVSRNHLLSIAAALPRDKELAMDFLETSVRELKLIAYMIYPVEYLDEEQALHMALDAERYTDLPYFFVFDMLRQHPQASVWAENWLLDETPIKPMVVGLVMIGRALFANYEPKRRNLLFEVMMQNVFSADDVLYKDAFTAVVRWARADAAIAEAVRCRCQNVKDHAPNESELLQKVEILLEEI